MLSPLWPFFVFAAICGLLVLTGCGGSRYLPYVPQRAVLGSRELLEIVRSASRKQNLPVRLISAVIWAESGGDARALSTAGAQGLMQLMPATARDCGVESAFDPTQNIDCGSRYLRGLIRRYHGNIKLALAAYNAGPAAVNRFGGIPPYAETRAYVARVFSMYLGQANP